MKKLLRLALWIFIPLLFFVSIFFTFTRGPSIDEPSATPRPSKRPSVLPRRGNSEATTVGPPATPAPSPSAGGDSSSGGGGGGGGGRADSGGDSPAPAQLRLGGDEARAAAVKAGFQHAWGSYRELAWGRDELRPLSRAANDWGGFGLTITDALDTAYLMGLTREFEEGATWIDQHLDFDKTHQTSTFEIIIRVLGGLLAAHDLSGDERLLRKAADMGERLLAAFESPVGLPWPNIDLHQRKGSMASWLGGNVALSEVATLQMELIRLAALTRDPRFARVATRVTQLLQALPRPNGLTSIHINFNSAQWAGSPRVTLGALGDSFYEYLIKTYLLTNGTARRYLDLYNETARAILKYMIRYTTRNNYTYLIELGDRMQPTIGPIHKMDHLACFAAGMFALGSRAATQQRDEFEAGEGLAEICWQMYAQTATGIGPEIIKFDLSNRLEDFYVPGDAHHYLLRPEAAEAWFYMWRLTGQSHWREAAWSAWQAIEKYCRVDKGYSGIRDVTATKVEHDDLQQSFFLAETLKYLYLIFMPSDYVSLDEYVFNTEAHPLRVFTPEPWLAELL